MVVLPPPLGHHWNERMLNLDPAPGAATDAGAMQAGEPACAGSLCRCPAWIRAAERRGSECASVQADLGGMRHDADLGGVMEGPWDNDR